MKELHPRRLAEQVRQNLLALISLAVALTALTYNTWRNELTEYNRNQRAAGFEILTELARLQLTADILHYGGEEASENPIAGWARVLLIRDLSRIMPVDVQSTADELHATWESHWPGLGEREAATEAITESIEALRRVVLARLRALE